MIGQTIARYRVAAKLGGGGMGVVYGEHDERLEGDVATKVCPPHKVAQIVTGASLTEKRPPKETAGPVKDPLPVVNLGLRSGL